MKVAKSVSLAMAGLLMGGFLAIAAQAEDHTRGCPAKFSEFDLDGNGFITEQEWGEGHAKRMQDMAEQGRKMKHAGEMPTFASIDLDGDGQVGEEEFAAHKKAHQHQHQHKGEGEGKGKHHRET
jgi:Ca2+-binding EF-hand superfamily protein